MRVVIINCYWTHTHTHKPSFLLSSNNAQQTPTNQLVPTTSHYAPLPPLPSSSLSLSSSQPPHIFLKMLLGGVVGGGGGDEVGGGNGGESFVGRKLEGW